MEIMLNIFELSRVIENVESDLSMIISFFSIVQPYFSTYILKRSFYFLAFKTFNEKKIKVFYNFLLF